MIVTKIVGVLVITALAVAITRYPPSHPHTRINSLSHRFWRMNNHLSPINVAHTNEIDAPFQSDQVLPREPCSGESNALAVLPSKRTAVRGLQLYTPSKCVCPEVEVWYNLGIGHWPQSVMGRECFSTEREPTTEIYFPPVCKNKNVQCCDNVETTHCKQQYYPLHVLTRRMDPTDMQGQDDTIIPSELKSDWIYKRINISVACEITKN